MKNRTPRVTTQLLRRRARALKRHLPLAVAGDHHGVHQARVATRRLREAVPVLSSGLEDSKAGKASRKLRRLTRALGTVRELDVTLRLLDELARAERVQRDAVEEVRAHVIAERDDRRGVMLGRLEKVDSEKLARRLASVAEVLDASDSESWRAVLGSRLIKRGRRLRAAIDTAGQIYAPEQLHAVRIAAKKLRYALELAADGGVSAAAPHVRTIKRVQDVLGALHDYQVLQVHVAAVQVRPSSPRLNIQVALDALAQHIEGECRHLHGRYLVSSAGLREACDAIVGKVAPSMSGGGKRRTLKMALPRRTAAAEGGR